MFLLSNPHKHLGPGLLAEFSGHRDHLRYTLEERKDIFVTISAIEFICIALHS